MQADALLTQDELDFIQDMQHVPQLNQADPNAVLQVNGDPRLQQLLTRLVASEQVTLQAQLENQQISIPLQLVEDEFHAVHLQLGSPEIYEEGPRLRPWRFSMEQPSALLDAQGEQSELWVRDISFRGVLLEVRDERPPPARFELFFAPDGIQPIALTGTLRRCIDTQLAAYDLGRSAMDEIDRLREYILQAHPQLRTAAPNARP
ncbi:hypothetical protein IAE35_21725 [Pseudomonas sp. S75]|uniref:hypothetical protein n=1 Tax=unclassified Pseudomonas TaxID=196821 RepID=UPI001904FB50|nr:MULTISPECIES: hypothetical protein [unclassified Pseudomonas]MBJ9978137.1 hypothetical protein [Pseudomonas sp. S30]MBK0155968.1 hypothetical protein [Pseudomonas sp. S75]